MIAGGDHTDWTVTMPAARTSPEVVEVVMSGALGPAAHSLMRDTLRIALLTARAPVPGALWVKLAAVISCDSVLPQELEELAAACVQDDVPLRIDVSPAILPLLSTTELAPLLYLTDATGAPEPALRVEVAPSWIDKTTLVIAITGDLDLASTPRMRDEVAVILAARPLRLVLDLTAVRFLASIGVNEIVRLAHSAVDDAITLHIAAGEYNRRTFEILGLADTLLRTFDTRVDALAAFSG